MEQARYWMWTKRKHDLGTDFNDHVISSSSHVHPSVTVAAAAAATAASFGDSWEEQAFAEDAAGSLGGCIWPPRSYSCSFCRREFKSAQALGGHMNVHRRDRARLKQSPPNQEREREREGEKVLLQNHHHHHHHNFLNYNPQICTYLYKRSSDDSSSSPPPLPLPPPPPPSIRVSALPPPDHDKTAPFLTSIIINPEDDDDDDDDRKKHVTPEQSWSNFVSDKKKMKKSSSGSTKSSSESNLSVSLNLLLCRAQIRNASAIDGDKETTCQTSKRRRLIDASSFTLFPKSSEMVLKNIPSSSMEDLDLELRLGDPPKVK